MSKLTADEISRLAIASPTFGAMLKVAAGGQANFNENVPATQTTSDGSSYPPNSAPVGEAPPPQEEAPPQEGQYAAVPQEEAPVEEAPTQDTPEAVGARAAQAFLGPIMDQALTGDPASQDIVAKAAGSVAGSVAAEYSKSMGNSPAIAGEAQQGAPMAQQPPPPPAVTTPEEDMANQIAGEQSAPPPPGAPPPQQQQGDEGGEEEVDENGKPKKKSPFPPKK